MVAWKILQSSSKSRGMPRIVRWPPRVSGVPTHMQPTLSRPTPQSLSRRVPTHLGDGADHDTYPNCCDRVNTKSPMHDVRKIILEGRALTTALAVLEADGSICAARRECLQFLDGLSVVDIESATIASALRRICGLPQTQVLHALESTTL